MNRIPGPGCGPLEGAVDSHGTQSTGTAGRPANAMSERRAEELANALVGDPWVDVHVRQVCKQLLKQWAKEDERLGYGDTP